MKVQWLVEPMGNVRPDWVQELTGNQDENDVKLLRTFKGMCRSHLEIKQIPFTQTILGMEQLSPGLPAVMYGSTQIVDKVTEQYGEQVSTFSQRDWWDPVNWIGKRSDLLNESVTIRTVKDLRAKWVDTPNFVKSRSVKALNGMVIEPSKQDHDDWLIEHSELDGGDELVLSPIHKIDREWRFFVVNGKIISGSTYRYDGRLKPRHPVSPAAYEAAKKAIQEWMPSQNIVIDLARVSSGDYKVVEFNCLSSSGFYNNDVVAIVEAMEAVASL